MWSEAHAGTKDEKVVHEVELAVRQAVWDGLEKGDRVVEFISPKPMKVHHCSSANRTENLNMHLQRTLLPLIKTSSGEQ